MVKWESDQIQKGRKCKGGKQLRRVFVLFLKTAKSVNKSFSSQEATAKSANKSLLIKDADTIQPYVKAVTAVCKSKHCTTSLSIT